MMKKVSIVCVNYNSYEELEQYLDSIEHSFSVCKEIELIVYIADNSEEKKSIKKTYSYPLVIANYDNLGYFGAIDRIIKDYPSCIQVDYFIISNVDVKIKNTFFPVLEKTEYKSDVAWIAPKIFSMASGLNRNPKILTRYSKEKLRILKLMYDLPVLSFIYEKLFFKKRTDNKIVEDGCPIYAGHGSFIILTKSFFENKCYKQYPIFLFGEEIFLAEQIRLKNLCVVYNNALEIEDTDHVSTSKMKSKLYYKYNSKSLKFILENYYE